MGNREAFGKHEQFEIVGRSAGAQQIRQERFEPGEWSCHVLIRGHAHVVGNYSAFGLAVVGDAAVDCDETDDVALRMGDVEVARLRLRRVRVEVLADGRRKTAFAIVGEPLSLSA